MSKNLIFIVAYNHEHKIEKVISRIPDSILANLNNEVLIIDDGSKDQTFYESDGVRKKIQCSATINVMKNPINQGYGGNQKLGYRYAIDNGFNRVFLIHGDGEYAPELLVNLIDVYEKDSSIEAVFGIRKTSWASSIKGGVSFFNFIGNKILTKIQNFILKSSMSEFHSGYRSYSVALLKRIPFEANTNDFHFDTEILIQSLAAKANIVEIPIPTNSKDESCHFNGLKYAKNVIFTSLRYKIQQMGFLYDRKFDLGIPEYHNKASRFSSHSRIVEKVSPFTRVLDVGCGSGNIAKHLIQKGCIVDGVDILPANEVVAPLRNYYKIDLIRNLEGLVDVLMKNAYDYILLADILEHLTEPEQLLDLIRNEHRIHPRPIVIASTGNVGFMVIRIMLMLGQFNYATRGILDRTHRRLFTKQSFYRMFEQAGFMVQEQKGIPMPFTIIFGGNSALGELLETINEWFAKFWPSTAAYQLIISAQPLPTASQLLAVSANHSEDLRVNNLNEDTLSGIKSNTAH